MKGKLAEQYPSSEGSYTDLKVCKSAAGYYVGTMFEHNETSDTPDLIEPGSRESDYYATSQEAQEALDSQEWDQRPSPDHKHNAVMFESSPQ